MSDVTLEQVVHMIAQLSPEDRATLIQTLQAAASTSTTGRVTRDTIIIEHIRRLAAGEFDQVESLFGRYARPGLDISLEDIVSTDRPYANNR